MDDKLVLKLAKECKQLCEDWTKASDDSAKYQAVEYKARMTYLAKQEELKQAVEQSK